MLVLGPRFTQILEDLSKMANDLDTLRAYLPKISSRGIFDA